MPSDLGPISLNRQIADIQAQLRRLRTASSGTFDPNADPVVIGNGAGSTATTAVSIGKSADANGLSATAVGPYSEAAGSDSVAIGVATARPAYSIAIGDAQVINAAQAAIGIGKSVIVGHNTLPVGADAVGIGSTCQVRSDGAVSLGGFSAVLTGSDNSVAIGYSAAVRANFAQSVALGAFSVVTEANQIMLGTATEYVEIPGNGIVLTDSASGRWRVTVDTSGALVVSAA